MTPLKELKKWAEDQYKEQLKQESSFTIVLITRRSIWERVISKINSMIETNK